MQLEDTKHFASWIRKKKKKMKYFVSALGFPGLSFVFFRG